MPGRIILFHDHEPKGISDHRPTRLDWGRDTNLTENTSVRFSGLELSKHAEQSLYGGPIGGIHTPVDVAYDGILVDDHIPPKLGRIPLDPSPFST